MLRKILYVTGLVTALSLFSFASCEDPVPPEPEPTPEPTPSIKIASSGGITVTDDGNATASVAAEGGTLSVSFNSATKWTASGGNDWCTVSPTSGNSGNVSVTLTVKPNTTSDDRSATVSLQSGTVRRSIAVTQKAANTMLVTPSSISVPAEGGSYEIKVQHNVEYSFSLEESAKGWITVTGTKALSTHTVEIAVSANEDPTVREGGILFKSTAGEVRVTVTQAGADVFTIAPTEVRLGGEGGTFEITVTATRSYHLSSKPDWVSEVSVKDKVHTFSASVNDGKEERSGVMVFCDDRGVCLPVSVKQEGLLRLSVEPQTLSFKAEGGSASVAVVSTVKWKAQSNADWCKVKPASGSSNATLTVTASPFMQQGSREAEIFFTGEGGLSQSLKVSQAGLVTFAVSPNTVSLGYEGGTFEVTVSSSLSYHISSMPEWIQEVSVENKVHTFRAAANNLPDTRNGVVVFCDDEGTCLPCSVTQKGNPVAIDWTKEFAHKSLMMRFTATWCGWCPRMGKAVSTAQAKAPGKIEALNLHTSGSNLVFDQNSALESQFHIMGFPSGIVDGRRLVENYSLDYTASLINSFVEETEQNYPVATTVGFTSSFSGSQLKIDLRMYARKADDYKITVLVTESGIVGYQADYEEGNHEDYHHDNVARIAVTNVLGEAVSVTEDQSIVEKSWTVTVPSSYVKENLRVVVIVQRAFGSKPRIVTEGMNYGDYYVDNCISGKAGTTVAPALVGEASGGNEDITNGNPVNW